jgi:hypothetical protein
MINIIIGLCLLALGISGIATNWWAVVDFVGVLIPLALVTVGVVSILAGLNSHRARHAGTARKGG